MQLPTSVHAPGAAAAAAATGMIVLVARRYLAQKKSELEMKWGEATKVVEARAIAVSF